MAAANSVAPVIIKRKKVISGGGHHGGAWKVAYADFVTAMMAFFMLMWLLNATTEKQRKGIADYFNPNIPINRISGGGDGALFGDSIFTKEALARSGTGALGTQPPWAQDNGQTEETDTEITALRELEALQSDVEDALLGGGESLIMANALRHIVTRLTDEGATIEIFEIPGHELFDAEDHITPTLSHILAKLGPVIRAWNQKIALKSYVQNVPVTVRSREVWLKSIIRAENLRSNLYFHGLEDHRIKRIVGLGASLPAVMDPMSVRNNRVEIVFLTEH